MTFKTPSPESSTGWRTKRYRQTLNAKEEDKLWEIIEEFVDSGSKSPRAQLRFFLAIDAFTKNVHIERLRWKKMKQLKIQPKVDSVFNQAYTRWNLTFDEIKRKLYYGNKRKEDIMRARKFVITELKKHGLSLGRISKLIGVSWKAIYIWENYDIKF